MRKLYCRTGLYGFPFCAVPKVNVKIKRVRSTETGESIDSGTQVLNTLTDSGVELKEPG